MFRQLGEVNQNLREIESNLPVWRINLENFVFWSVLVVNELFDPDRKKESEQKRKEGRKGKIGSEKRKEEGRNEGFETNKERTKKDKEKRKRKTNRNKTETNEPVKQKEKTK